MSDTESVDITVVSEVEYSKVYVCLSLDCPLQFDTRQAMFSHFQNEHDYSTGTILRELFQGKKSSNLFKS